jgi:hypothetical protein
MRVAGRTVAAPGEQRCKQHKRDDEVSRHARTGLARLNILGKGEYLLMLSTFNIYGLMRRRHPPPTGAETQDSEIEPVAQSDNDKGTRKA